MIKKARTSAVTTIRDTQGSEIYKAVITPESRRKFQLMSEDSLTHDFRTAEPLALPLGAYVEDELFGRFYLTEQQTPTYEENTGAWHYTLRFDRRAFALKNHLHGFVGVSGKRSALTWNLTGTLAQHLEQLRLNVAALAKESAGGKWYQIVTASFTTDESVTNAAEIKHIKYDRAAILEAMTLIAEAYGLEWYDTSGEGAQELKVTFGKLQRGEPRDFRLGYNVERMTAQRGANDYFNTLFAFGGSRNLPFNYRRELPLTITRASGAQFNVKPSIKAEWVKGYKKSSGAYVGIEEKSIPASERYSLGPYTIEKPDPQPGFPGATTEEKRQRAFYRRAFTATPTKTSVHQFVASANVFAFGVCGLILRVYVGAELLYTSASTTYTPSTMEKNTLTLKSSLITCDFEAGKSYDIKIEIEADMSEAQWEEASGGTYSRGEAFSEVRYYGFFNNEENSGFNAPKTTLDIPAEVQVADPTNARGYKLVQITDGYHLTRLNFYDTQQAANAHTTMPNKVDIIKPYDLEASDLKAVNFTPKVGQVIYLSAFMLNSRAVSAQHYKTPFDDPTSLTKLGERLLMLPRGEYLQTEEARTGRDVRVEAAVQFEDIYPKVSTTIQSVRAQDVSVAHTLEDGTSEQRQQTRYLVTLTNFNFSADYIKEGEELRLNFQPSAAVGGSGHALGGMSFAVQWKEAERVFVIVPSEDYGAEIPSSALAPKVGDACFLSGFDPEALGALGAVSAAEEALEQRAQEYLEEMQKGAFTFTCEMMSDNADGSGGARLVFRDSARLTIRDSEGAVLMQRTPGAYEEGGIIEAGQRVRLFHPALKEGEMTSRVIGYELGGDIPQDTPTYIVGESEIYSRLKQIEKTLKRL